MGKKILLADDSITIQKVIELTFSDEDFEVVTVGNGRLAIERVQEARPDVVLCDIIMPEKDGYEVCEFIKKNAALSHVPVLLLTGAFEPFDQERAARAGCDGFLAKPFEPQTLIAKVKDLLSQAVARPAAAAPVAAPAPAPPPAFVAPAPPAPAVVTFAPAPVPATPAPAATFTPTPATFAPPSLAFTPTPGSAYTPPATAGAPPTPIAFGTTLPEEPPAAPATLSEPAMTYVAEETPIDEAPLGFADVMDTVPAPAETFDEPELEPAAFVAPAEETAPEESLLDVSPEERATLEPPPPQVTPQPGDSSSTVMFQASGPLAWTPPTLEPPVEERAEETVQSVLGEASMFEEVFEEDLSAIPPVQAATLQAPVPAAAEVPPAEPVFQEPAPARVAAAPEEAEESLSDALAAEEPPPASEAAEVAVPVDQVAQIAQRVVGQISEKVIREIAWEVIPDLAEALIRKEIERLKAELQQS